MGVRRLCAEFKLTQMMKGQDTTSPQAVCLVAIEKAIDKAFAKMDSNESPDLLDVIRAYDHRSKKDQPPVGGNDRLGEAIDRLTGRRAAIVFNDLEFDSKNHSLAVWKRGSQKSV